MRKQNKYWYERLNNDKRREELKKDTVMFLRGILAIGIITGFVCFIIWFKKG